MTLLQAPDCTVALEGDRTICFQLTSVWICSKHFQPAKPELCLCSPLPQIRRGIAAESARPRITRQTPLAKALLSPKQARSTYSSCSQYSLVKSTEHNTKTAGTADATQSSSAVPNHPRKCSKGETEL